MATNRIPGSGGASRLVALLALPVALQACSAPTEPPRPPSGGHQLNLSFEDFEARIEPVLVRHGCDAGGDCHGGGIRGSLELSPQGAKNARFDFDQVVLQVSAMDPATSPILTEPLALEAGGTPHGVKPFASTADTDYQAVLDWISDGVAP
jgi:hypothetical protein